ncbi:MAG: alpha/beta hydrolase [Terracoccus sp.]
MLNDPPAPEDLPDAPKRPYAAVPPSVPREPAAGGGSSAQPSPRAIVAVAVVAVLLAVAALAVWRLGPLSDTPVAIPTTRTTSPGPTTSPTPSPSASSPSTSPTPAPGAASYPKELAAFYTQSLSWTACADDPTQQCSNMEVPVDYTKPTGDRFTLALRKAPALDPGQRVGSLVINPGGPGGSGVEYATYAQYVFSKQLRSVYDIVGFDPRGIGASDAVTCLTDTQMDTLFGDDPTPDTAAERRTLIDDADRITKSCAATGGERARHMGTTEVARDMDVMRVLLGDPKLNYFGVSYGTFLGALYADLFPKNVGRFVLDSAISPNQTDAQEMTYDIQGFESSIDAFISWCVARPDCALGSDEAAARGKIVTLLDTVEAKELKTSIPGLEKVGEGWTSFAIFMCLYSETSWPTLNKGLAQAFTGRGDVLLAKAMSVVERSTSGRYADTTYLQAMIPVRCEDWPRSPETPAVKAAQAKAQADHPLWARMTGELYDNCEAWPDAGRPLKGSTLAVGAAPILVIGNLRDPATPIGGTKQLAKDLDSGVLVTSDHDGHGTYLAGNSCVDAIVDRYLMKGAVPQDGKAC